jgi:hypothetical protein
MASLILGCAGVGKTLLVRQMRSIVSFLWLTVLDCAFSSGLHEFLCGHDIVQPAFCETGMWTGDFETASTVRMYFK